MGDVVANAWRWLGAHFANVVLDEWVVMPSHLHGILVLTTPVATKETGDAAGAKAVRRKSVGGLVGAFKTRSTNDVNRLRRTPGAVVWQRNYWDRVIRDDGELVATREYIRRNPETYRPRTYTV